MTHEQSILGREADITSLERSVLQEAKRVVWIWGERGIGKTTIANELMEASHIGGRFDTRLALSGLNPRRELGSEDRLVFTLARQVLKEVPPKLNANELLDHTLARLRNTPALVLLDNAETLDGDWCRRLTQGWLSQCCASVLLLTSTTEPPPGFGQDPGFLEHRVQGLDADSPSGWSAAKQLLGSRLVNAFGEADLKEIVRSLGGNPVRLLYLGWQSPSTSDELRAIADDLQREASSEERTAAGLDVIESVLKRINAPLVHFLALGRVRDVEVDEKLLSWLWDQLGGGTVEVYLDVRRKLMDAKLLDTGRALGRVRISTDTHMKLEKYLFAAIGKRHMSHVDYYLAEYYRAEYVASKVEGEIPDLSALGRYVDHSLPGGNVETALRYILESGTITELHHRGLSVGLRPVLAGLDGYLIRYLEALRQVPDGSAGASEAHKLAETLEPLHAQVKIELAHCQNDLSEHKNCLQSLHMAEQLLQRAPPEDAFALRQRISHLRGISHSDLGDSDECIRAYFSVVERGIEKGEVDQRVLLVLGYLAFELRFYDFALAKRAGELAVNLSREYGDEQLLAKNLCSLSQTLFFENEVDNAERLLDRAQALCGTANRSSDQRELGRVLVHRGVIEIGKGNHKYASRLLCRAARVNMRNGDRRRQATAKGLRAVCLYHLGKHPEALKELNTAIREHVDIEDWRCVSMEALTAAYMQGKKTLREIRAATEEQPLEQWARALAGRPDQTSLYDTYWSDKYRPRLLEN